MIEEQDSPVIDATQNVINEALRLLNTLDIKYQLQFGTITPDQWKKKIEDTFEKDKYYRSLRIVESFTTNEPSHSILIEQKVEQVPWKRDALNSTMQIINPDIETVKEALIQIMNKRKLKSKKRL